MAATNRLEYNLFLNINSAEDLEQSLGQQITVATSKYSPIPSHTLLGTQTNLDLSNAFKELYRKCLGSSICEQIIGDVESYQELLQDSLLACNEISSLLITSLKCHWKALNDFNSDKSELAMAQMAETEILAKKIGTKYKELATRFGALCKSVRQKVLANNSERFFTEIGKLHTGLCNMKSFCYFSELHCKQLENPTLADPLAVELMANEGENEFYRTFEKIEQLLPGSLFEDSPKPTLDDVFASMKTGRSVANLDRKKECVIVDQLRFRFPEGIENNFEYSCRSWLALAKTNQIMINSLHIAKAAMQDAMEQV